MDTKLTLKLDEIAIQNLKAYAKSRGTSVSRLKEDYVKNNEETHDTQLI